MYKYPYLVERKRECAGERFDDNEAHSVAGNIMCDVILLAPISNTHMCNT